MTTSATMEVFRRASELRQRGVRVVDLGAGEPDFPSPATAVETACQALVDGFTKYTPLAGTLDLRCALAARFHQAYGASWDPEEEVLVTVGAKAALFELALALFEDGDEVVVPTPCWVSFPDQVRLAGATPVPAPMSAQDGFAIRAEPLFEAMSEATRGVVLNSPCNPTGGVMGAGDLRRLVEVCARREIVVIADETYERFVYDGAAHASAASLASEFPETVVVVGSFSKTYAMTGWRVGYALGHRALIAGARKVQSHATSNVTSFAMSGALAALEGAQAEVQAMIAEYQARRDLVIGGLNAIPGVRCPPPSGAFYAFPDVSACYGPGKNGSQELARHLLDEFRLAVVPGVAFGEDRHLRLSFAASRDELREGVDRLARALT